MIAPIFVISSIFIAIAFLVTENNAKYLLSGYNTMSDAEREKFDIKGYIRYFRNFHIFLGISSFTVSLLLLFLADSDWSSLFLGGYPVLAYVYFIGSSIRFSKNNSKRQRLLNYIAMGVLLLVFALIAYEFVKQF